MYDFHKASLKLNPNKLLNNQNLSFIGEFNHNTGEIIEKEYVAELNNLKISIKEKRYIELSGSLHKYFNNGITNETDYKIQDYYETLQRLWLIAEISPFSAVLHNLEFGVNINLPFETKSFIEHVIAFKTKSPAVRNYKTEGFMKKFVFQNNYEIKIYDKGSQYNLPYSLLRFEIKVRKMNYFKIRKINVKDYYDLLRIEIIDKLKKLLLKTFRELKYFECQQKKHIKKKEYCLIVNGQKENYWKELRKKNLSQYKKQRKEFKELIVRYSDNSKFEIVSQLLERKLNEITVINDNLRYKIDSLYNNFGFSDLTYLLPRENVPHYVYLFTTSNSKLSRTPLNNCYSFGRSFM